MKRYRAIVSVKPEVDTDDENLVGFERMIMDFWIGDNAEVQAASEVVRLDLKALNLTYYTTFTIEELLRTPAKEPWVDFDAWLASKPYGGPSKTPGRRLISDSTAKLMEAAWNAAREGR